jgi:uncharacterized protein (DUF1800 family)
MAHYWRIWLSATAAICLAACSGGASDPASSGAKAVTSSQASGHGALDSPPTPNDAARFLTQATMGPTDESIAAVTSAGYLAWLNQQIAMPVSGSHLTFMKARATAQAGKVLPDYFYESFWQQAASAPDQLRQRVKLAYSEIFVISFADPNVDVSGAGSYYDMLGANAFGNFRTLLEQVALHPAMGVYLTWLANQPADPATGRHPDQNFARESMQLMTIGLWQLNPDGTQKLNSAGQPISTYSGADIAGLADVFTGYSWYSAHPTTNSFLGKTRDAAATTTPMIAYPAFHATTAKTFLGTTIPASTVANPSGDLKIALDTLFNHPNTGPFISRQLIQRLVTSNPSPDYVARVAAVFANNGSGVRGDMGAVIKAILLDPDARDTAGAQVDPNFGKLREPVVRMANWMRAFGTTSTSGNWLLTSTSANTSLDQSVMNASSVFNFWRPGYSPPETKLGKLGYVAPEFQVVDEVSVAGYLNTMQGAIGSGVGTGKDINTAYPKETALAADPAQLTDRVNQLLMYGQMSSNLRSRILGAVSGVNLPAAQGTARTTALSNRTKLAIFMAMASPEYLAQR